MPALRIHSSPFLRLLCMLSVLFGLLSEAAHDHVERSGDATPAPRATHGSLPCAHACFHFVDIAKAPLVLGLLAHFQKKSLPAIDIPESFIGEVKTRPPDGASFPSTT